MCTLSNSAKFSAGRLLLPAYNFSATMATTYSTHRLGAVASLIFFAIENMPPHFSTHVYYGQTAGWIKITLCTEVGLDPGHTVLDGHPLSPRKEAQLQSLTFRPMSIVAKRLNASGYQLVRRYASAQATL